MAAGAHPAHEGHQLLYLTSAKQVSPFFASAGSDVSILPPHTSAGPQRGVHVSRGMAGVSASACEGEASNKHSLISRRTHLKMNVLSNPMLRGPQEPRCGQDLTSCPSAFTSHLHPPPAPGGPARGGPYKAGRELSAEEQQELRRKINSRERKRMQDLNVAMDALREVMVPYASSTPAASAPPHSAGAPPGRRLSKISTLVLARNYILLLGSSLQEMRRLLGELSSAGAGPGPRLLLTGGWPLVSSPGRLLLTREPFPASPPSSALKCPLLSPGLPETSLPSATWGLGPASALPLCPCGACRLPRLGQPAPPPRFPK
ncbi:oligodendrocyte transcription factor 1 [Festucalex cinctus]